MLGIANASQVTWVDGLSPFAGHRLLFMVNRAGFSVPVDFQNDISSFLHTIDVFALASRSEGFGQVVIEAMASGKPVVVSRIAPLTEVVVDGETGLCVEPENPHALAKAIVWLIEHPEEARRIGQKGMKRVKEIFSAERMTQETIGVYRELLEK